MCHVSGTDLVKQGEQVGPMWASPNLMENPKWMDKVDKEIQ